MCRNSSLIFIKIVFKIMKKELHIEIGQMYVDLGAF